MSESADARPADAARGSTPVAPSERTADDDSGMVPTGTREAAAKAQRHGPLLWGVPNACAVHAPAEIEMSQPALLAR